jgi:hypothetical protein
MIKEKRVIEVEVESYLGTRYLYETVKAEVLEEVDTPHPSFIVKMLEGLSKGLCGFAFKREGDIPIVLYEFKFFME